MITFISASAGSGKTHCITHEIVRRVADARCRPSGLIATTYTRKAAAELRERLRRDLHRARQTAFAERLDEACVGTVHSVCGQLLERFAFEAGISPRLRILPPPQAGVLLAHALEDAAAFTDFQNMDDFCRRFGLIDRRTSEPLWKGHVRDLIDAARANAIAPDHLPSMADTSADELLAFLPAPLAPDSDPDTRLLEAIDQAIAGIDLTIDKTKKTEDYLQDLRTRRGDLADRALPWPEWVALTKALPAKAHEAVAIPVVEAASAVERHPRLHADLRDYTGRIFDLARAALETFQRLKEESGVLDYADLEHRAYCLLREQPAIRDLLREELDLVVVDEFQDTSPLQLALFLELAACARETLWVGDVKQAIYGFRGSDPDLIGSVLDGLPTHDGRLADPLRISWRSTPALVHLANALFVPAFNRGLGLPEAQVRLHPSSQRAPASDPALEFFRLLSGQTTRKGEPKRLKEDDYAATLADATVALLAPQADLRVVDRETGGLRPVTLRDVAVLCRDNTEANLVAAALSARGLPVNRQDLAVLATPEARLALAALRRLADPQDSLAAAEIVALTCGQEPETWLQQRLEYLDQRRAAGEAAGADRWGLEPPFEHPILIALDIAHATLAVASPAEALDLALRAVDAFRTVSAWGPHPTRSTQRHQNLETVRALAAQYEDACRTAQVPATIAGFLLAAPTIEQADPDTAAGNDGMDAVHVGTYHKAKGLEWPVVLASSLDTEPRPRLWGLTVARRDDSQPLDFRQPLADRWLRFRLWPFGRHVKGVTLADQLDASPAGQAARAAATQEELRLLYVGFTRARDRLIIVRDPARDTPWLDLLQAPWFADLQPHLDLPDGQRLACRSQEFTLDTAAAPTVAPIESAWFPPPLSSTPRPPALITPSHAPAATDAAIGRSLRYQGRLGITGRPDDADLGDALHAIVAAELLHPGRPDRRTTAQRILEGFGLTAALDPDHILAQIDRFNDQLRQTFHARSVEVEVPFSVERPDGQRVTGIIDLLLDTPDGWVVIDHKSFPGPEIAWPERALSHAGQLALYQEALTRATRPVATTWIHFVTGGALVEVQIPAPAAPRYP